MTIKARGACNALLRLEVTEQLSQAPDILLSPIGGGNVDLDQLPW